MARRSRPAPARAIAWSSSAWRSRATTWVETGSRSRPRPARTRSSNSGDVAAYVPTAPEIAPTDDLRERALQALDVARRLHREARELDAERRGLGVDAVRAADADGVHVLARALAQRRDELARAGEDDLAGGAQLQAGRGVEDVARRQAEVDPAAGVAGGLAEDVDERRDVVVGRPLALVDGLDGERRRADRVELLRRTGPSIASQAATSTRRHASMRASSVQRAPISGRV